MTAEAKERVAAGGQARAAAVKRVLEAHADDLAAAVEEERAKRGLPPSGGLKLTAQEVQLVLQQRGRKK